MIKDGRPVDFGSFLIPRTEYRIDDVWHVVGLRGTGSNTVVVKDVFVPRHRFLSYKAMNDGTAGGYQTNTAPVYKMPWGTMHPTTISAPIVGMAYGRTTRTSSTRASGCARRSPGEGQGRPVRQGAHRRSGQRHRRGVAPVERQRRRRVRVVVRRQGDPVRAARPRRRDQVRATGRAIASIDRLFEASGATALGNDQPVQRFWRDAHAGRVHAANDPERAYQIFGNNEFGLPPGDTMV